MGRQVLILQDESGAVLSVHGNLKAIAEKYSEELLSYRQLQRLIKSAKENGKNEIPIKSKTDSITHYKISWWEI